MGRGEAGRAILKLAAPITLDGLYQGSSRWADFSAGRGRGLARDPRTQTDAIRWLRRPKTPHRIATRRRLGCGDSGPVAVDSSAIGGTHRSVPLMARFCDGRAFGAATRLYGLSLPMMVRQSASMRNGAAVAQRVQTLFIDDLDGSAAEGTVRFGLDGTEYEIDLNAEHAQQLRDTLAAHVQAGRRVSSGSRRPARSGRRAAASGPNTTEVREWAKTQGIEVKDRGRVPAELVVKFRAATGQ